MVYNADLILRGGELRPLAASACSRRSCGWRSRIRCRARFRTGATLAMFTLVVFTLVTGTAAPSSFDKAWGTSTSSAAASRSAPARRRARRSTTCRLAVRQAPGIDEADFAAVGSQSVLSVKAKQLGTGRPAESYVARGLDRAFLEHTTFGLGAMARGYASARGGLDTRSRRGRGSPSSTRPSRRAATTGASPSCRTSSSPASSSKTASSTRSRSRSATRRPGVTLRLTVIGILKDAAPLEMVGISSSQATYQSAFPGRFSPDDPLLRARRRASTPPTRRPGSSPRSSPNGMQAESIQQVVDDTLAANRTLNRLIQGFMGLGPDRRRRRTRRDQRPRGRRAAPADRRAASDRLPAGNGAGGLPDRVVVHRADVDRGRHAPRPRARRRTSSATRRSSRAGRT